MSIQELFDMGKHSFYVWTSYGIAIVIFGALFAMVKLQRKKIIKQIRRRRQLQIKLDSERAK